MAKQARIARSDDDLPSHLRARIEAIRAELRQLNYRRMTDEELAEALDLDVQAKASNAVEGLYADAAEDAFFVGARPGRWTSGHPFAPLAQLRTQRSSMRTTCMH